MIVGIDAKTLLKHYREVIADGELTAARQRLVQTLDDITPRAGHAKRSSEAASSRASRAASRPLTPEDK
jgi:hypothetical protein